MAEALNLDPFDVRLKNAIRQGGKTHFGQTLDEHVSVVKELELLKPHYDAAKARLEERRANATGSLGARIGHGVWVA